MSAPALAGSASSKQLVAFASSADLVVPALAARATAVWPMDGSLPNILDQSGRGNHLTRYMQPATSNVTFLLGANSVGSQSMTGRLSKWGNWKRLLTAAEKAALRGGEAWPFSTTTTLRDASVFYLLNEASNSSTYADATGRGNTLVKSANPTVQVAGPLGTDKGVQLGSSGASYLILDPATADVANGNHAHTISGWVNLDALGASQQIFWGQLEFATTKVGNCLYYFSSTNRLQSDFANNADLYRNAVVVADTFGAPGTGVWHHMLFQYDPVTNVETLEIDGVADSLAEVVRPAPRTSPSRSHFAVPPWFTGTGHSGWDSVGVQCFASHAASADLSFGPHSKTAWGWVKFDNTSSTQTVMGCFQETGTLIDWVIQQAGGLMYFVLGNNAGAYDFITVPLADASWHSFACWYDTSAGRIYIDLDNGAHTANTAVTHTPSAGTMPFIMGACSSSTATGANQQLLGDIGIAGISDGVPSQAEIAQLYAYGSGRYY